VGFEKRSFAADDWATVREGHRGISDRIADEGRRAFHFGKTLSGW
jgi:hypothetical protein